jgi:hypothetical protein
LVGATLSPFSLDTDPLLLDRLGVESGVGSGVLHLPFFVSGGVAAGLFSIVFLAFFVSGGVAARLFSVDLFDIVFCPFIVYI